jgi:hypothetical protein
MGKASSGHITSGEFYWRWDTSDGPQTARVTLKELQATVTSSDWLNLLHFLTACSALVMTEKEKQMSERDTRLGR